MTPSMLDMIATHLNAPCGPLVTPEAVENFLRPGVQALRRMEPATASVLPAIFEECRTGLIDRARDEAGIAPAAAVAAYASLIRHGGRRMPAWDARMDGS